MRTLIAVLFTLLWTVCSVCAQTAACDDIVFGNKGISSMFYELGRSREDAKDYKGAVIAHTQAIKFDPDNSLAWADRGFDRYRIGDTRGGIEDLTQVIRLVPFNSYGAYCGCGLMRAELGEDKEAISDFTNAIQLRPERAHACVYRARRHCRVGNHSSALRDFQQAIKLKPSDLDAMPCT